MNVKHKKWMVAAAVHAAALLALSVLTPIANQMGAPILGGILILGYLLCARRVVRWSRRAWIQDAECPDCGEIVDLDGRWPCLCGFQCDRHAMEPCPHCRKLFSWIECPACGRSIEV